MLVIFVVFEIFVDCLDSIKDSKWVALPLESSRVEDAAIDEAASVVDSIMAHLWDALFCAAPNVRDARVEVLAKDFTHDGLYEMRVLPYNAPYKGWSPALRDDVYKAAYQMKLDLADMLVDMVVAHLNGVEDGGDLDYEIHRRR